MKLKSRFIRRDDGWIGEIDPELPRSVRMTYHAEEALQRGSALLAPLLLGHGFLFEVVDTGGSSGGHFASGDFRRGARRLKFQFRHGLGMVTYHLADRSMTHQQYMRSAHGSLGASHYPGFSGDPLDAFQHLLLDLEEFGSDFLGGTDDYLLRRMYDALASPIQKSGLPDSIPFEGLRPTDGNGVGFSRSCAIELIVLE